MNALLAAALLFAAPARDYDTEIAHQRRELDALRGQLEAQQRDLSLLKQKQSATLEELEHLSSSIDLTGQYLHKLESVETQLAASVNGLQEDLRSIQGSLDARGTVMARRVRLLYMAGRPEKLVFGAPSADEGGFWRRVYWVKRILRHDRKLVGESREDMDRKQEGLRKLLARRAELEAFQRRKREEMDRFTRARSDQEKTLRTLQQSASVKASALRQLQENAKQLTDIIAALEKRRREERARNPKKKARELEVGTRYCSPVQGPVVSRYGLQYHAMLGTTTRNLGIEIEASAGSAVRAVVSGEVALITRIPGYGQGIILDNGSGYFTIYANLGDIRVATGDKVKTCQEIGSEAPDPGRVYFEVRKGTETLNPETWLKERR